MGERYASAAVAALAATALAVAAVWLGSREASALSSQTAVYKSPAAANLFLGDPKLVIADRVEGVPPGLGLGAFQLHITFDPQWVAVDVSEGPFLGSTGRTTYCINQPSNGDVVISCVSTGTAPGPTGDGVLANISVRPATGLKLRATQYNFADVLVHDIPSNTALADTLGMAIAVISGGDSTVRVRPLEGDVNVDCVVDSVDQTAVASRLGAHIGSGSYSPYYDLEPASPPDGDIDILDLQFVTGRLGSTCQLPHPAQPGPPPPCSDNDGDLICDKADVDDDNDGLPDKYEVAHACLNSRLADASGDPDGDGLTSAAEATRGTDPCLQDTDADGMSDGYEVARSCLNPLVADASADADADGLSNMAEAGLSTNLCVADSDGDGLSDGAEVNTYNTNPLNADSDGDGLSDGAEVNTYGTNPRNADSDGDGLSDGVEVNTYGTNPLDADSDDDGLADGAEVNTYLTNPLDADSDDDGLSDGADVNTYLTNPLDADSDDDGLADGAEVNTHLTNPLDADSDDDGLSDGAEVNTYSTNPLLADSEGDGMADAFEVARLSCGLNPLVNDAAGDADSDALSNIAELSIGTDVCTADSDGDGCKDGAEVQTAPGSESTGGRRDPLNPWDYFNPTQDGVNRTDDISAVVRTYGHDQDIFLDYDVRYDRTPLMGGHPWQFGPPDGLIRTLEITAAVNSYGHDCAP